MQQYIVQPGDTLYSIARLFELATERLRSINPQLENTDSVFPGQVLNIPDTGQIRPTIEVNGFTFPTSVPLQWNSIFPYLTYLSIFGYEIRPGGELIAPNNEQLIIEASQARVAPLMAATNTINGAYSGDLLHSILSDYQAQETLISNCIATAQAYGFYGVTFGFEYLLPEDYDAYAAFLEQASNQLHARGLIIIASIRLVPLLENQARLQEALTLYSRILDRFILTPGDFTCTETIKPADIVQQGLDFMSRFVSNPKILLGIPNCCYEWEVPYAPNNEYRALSLNQADTLVRSAGASPQIDPNTQRTYFQIQDQDNIQHILVCDSAYNLYAMELVSTYNLGGVSFRTLSLFALASYQIVAVRHDVRKVLP